jgi:hypothetical protein
MFNFLTDATAIDTASGLDRNVGVPQWYVIAGSSVVLIVRE